MPLSLFVIMAVLSAMWSLAVMRRRRPGRRLAREAVIRFSQLVDSSPDRGRPGGGPISAPRIRPAVAATHLLLDRPTATRAFDDDPRPSGPGPVDQYAGRPRPGRTAPTAHLVLGGYPRTRIPVPTGGGTIGRDASRCDMTVDLPTVSRLHAELRPDRSGFFVTDVGSSNGITIDHARTSRGVLMAGGVLGLGRSVELTLEFDDA